MGTGNKSAERVDNVLSHCVCGQVGVNQTQWTCNSCCVRLEFVAGYLERVRTVLASSEVPTLGGLSCIFGAFYLWIWVLTRHCDTLA